jgi:hypothetical protein
VAAHELVRKRRKPVVLSLRPAKFDRYILAFNEAPFAQTAAECSDEVLGILWRSGTHEADHRHRRLLPPRRYWPRRRAADHPENLATTQLIKLHQLPLAKATQHTGLSRIA